MVIRKDRANLFVHGQGLNCPCCRAGFSPIELLTMSGMVTTPPRQSLPAGVPELKSGERWLLWRCPCGKSFYEVQREGDGGQPYPVTVSVREAK
jgi:hypothetical protein